MPEWAGFIRQWEKFRVEGVFDRRCIQAHHDLIAQRYRQIQDNPPYIMILGKNGWPDFFYRETVRLIEDPAMLMLFITALAYANTQVGYDAEESLLDKMAKVYGVGRYWVAVVTESFHLTPELLTAVPGLRHCTFIKVRRPPCLT